ncbi:MAG: hypothetical protein IIZ78_22605 [Clostridiales bacterium]|nr:hypothetical protein [Clostridiales bacterium]
MTREIAKRIVKGITDKIECNTADIDDWAEFWGFSREEYEEFLDMPIKTLEQESTFQKKAEIVISQLRADRDRLQDAFDKLRAEIERQEKWLMVAGYNQYNVDIALDTIKSVVDKYKAEGRDKE